MDRQLDLSVVCLILLFFSCFLGLYGSEDVIENGALDPVKSVVHIGAVLDLNSPSGLMVELCMRMAHSDFYKVHPDYTTQLKLDIKNAGSLLDANIAALELLRHEQVHGILGPQDETENVFITQLGKQVRVPIVCFSARSSSSSFTDKRYFVRAAPEDALQAQALAAIFRGFEWPEVVVLYEDTDYGNQFLSHINKAFQDVEAGIASMIAFSTTAEDSYMLKELERLKTKHTKVFLVHMSTSVGYKLFALAKSVGMMSKAYAWIISDSLSNFMNSMPYAARDSMEGVLGVRPYVYRSEELEDFQERWKRNMLLEKTKDSKTELSVYGLWAYDAITAVMIALEKIGPINSTFVNKVKNGTGYANLRTSEIGPRLLNELTITKFRGLAGDFQLVDRQLKQSAFEIINVYGSGERTVGFWTPDEGIVRELSSNAERTYSTSVKELKAIIWPGDVSTSPNGQSILDSTGDLRVGIPWKLGFKEFVSATVNHTTNRTNANGFAIDIFLAAREVLPFHINYDFQIYNDTINKDWSFDDMLHKIPQNFDMIVADTTIRAPRAEYVEFSLPYTESGVVLVVKNRKPYDMWIFIKPLRWDLWLAILVACISMGIVLRIMEQQVTRNNEDLMIIREQKERLGMIYWSPVAILAFPESNMVANKWSFFVLVFWMFMAFILMQSYTANLSAILTVDQLKFAFSDNYFVGCQEGSFMKDFLTEQLHISESRLKIYASAEEYHDAMSKGSKHGGIDAIFDEIPYMKIFLNKYDSEYKMVGPTYRTGGFAFPIGSPLTAHFSKAILDVTQGSNITAIDQKNFGPGYSSQDPLSSIISQGTSSLTLYEFAGLFIIVGSVTLFALFCSSTRIGRNLTGHLEQFIQLCACCKTPAKNLVDVSASGASAEGPDEHVNQSIESHADEDVIVQSAEQSGDEIQEIGAFSVEASVPQDSGAGVANNTEPNS